MNECVFIIFGATGDLSKRMLLPAIYRLLLDGKLKNFAIVGVALSPSTAHELWYSAQPFIKDVDSHLIKRLIDRTTYCPIDITSFDEFSVLKQLIESIEIKFKLLGNRLVYCATAAHFFCDITHNVGKSHIIERRKKEPWHRIVYEKPFGHDAHSAQQINECVMNYVCEEQVFRIDHYLTKEVVANIALLRFTNIVFEPLWNKKYIDHVQITLSETLGLEGRGRYYDKYGILDDVVQNHALQLLALIAMERPQQLTGTYIQERKTEVLKKVIFEDGLMGQFEEYDKEKDVAIDSKTATFCLLRLEVDTERWKGVPFYIKAGKQLDKKKTTIAIKFREVYCPLKEGQDCPCNYLIIEIAPHQAFSLELNIKPIGISHHVHSVAMDFSYKNFFGPKTPVAYEVLLEHIMQGEQAISVSRDEIIDAWKVIESIKKIKLPLYIYKKKSTGPQACKKFFKKYHVRWR